MPLLPSFQKDAAHSPPPWSSSGNGAFLLPLATLLFYLSSSPAYCVLFITFFYYMLIINYSRHLSPPLGLRKHLQDAHSSARLAYIISAVFPTGKPKGGGGQRNQLPVTQSPHPPSLILESPRLGGHHPGGRGGGGILFGEALHSSLPSSNTRCSLSSEET